MNNNSIIILYDNTLYNKKLKSGWGFSCLVAYENNIILFDTGADYYTLVYNMKHLNINPKTINAVVISHMHGDHTGGLMGFLKNDFRKNKGITIYLPSSVGSQDLRLIESLGVVKQNINIITKPQNLTDSIYSTGSLGTFIKEQSLVIKTKKGIIIITGCAHPGIAYIVEVSIKLFKNNPLLVLGGFHLFSKGKKEISKIIDRFKELKVKYVSPCHCSGDTARTLFKKEFGDHYISGGVGRIINFSDLN